MDMPEEDDDTGKLDLENLKELLEFAKGGMLKDLAKTYGKRLPGMDDTDMSTEGVPSDIPGVEEDTEGQESQAPDGGGLDPLKLKAALLKLKMG